MSDRGSRERVHYVVTPVERKFEPRLCRHGVDKRKRVFSKFLKCDLGRFPTSASESMP
jgi:hypothetical protein